jgi:hypothetical protein
MAFPGGQTLTGCCGWSGPPKQQQPIHVHGRTSDQHVQTFFSMTQKSAKSCFATHQRSRNTKRLLLLRLFLALLAVLRGETHRIAP